MNTIKQSSGGAAYEPTWASLDARPTPPWFDDSKFGLFVHWGVYSVPAWAPKRKDVGSPSEAYAEWFWDLSKRKDAPCAKFQQRVYGDKFRYQDFAPQFKAELFDPNQWADLFARSGARYVILTGKHHDGFCLWPSQHAWNWNSVDIGPHRDLVGDLSASVVSKGLRMALYYSLYEWYNPLYLSDPARYVAEHMLPQMKDLICRYSPSLLYTDGEWEQSSDVWRSPEFLAWLFNESPVKDEVAVNDRWGKETRSRHGGYYSTEYGEVGFGVGLAEGHKWEEIRGIGYSFGYNRNEDLEDYLSEKDLIHLLIRTVSKGGNLNLDVGPTADGRIPVIMQERLTQLGDWLRVNGEAIYGTRPWRAKGEGDAVCYTAKNETLYAICLGWPGRELVLREPKPKAGLSARLLGSDAAVTCAACPEGIVLRPPQLGPDQAPCRHACVFALDGVE